MAAATRARFVQAALTAPLALVPARVGAQTAATLRVASTASDGYAEGLYAQDRGFFRDAGLDATVTLLASGAAIAGAIAAGAVDVGITNPLPLASAVAHGVPFAYICSGGLYNPKEAALCVAADAPIQSAADLEAKPIACTSLTDIDTVAIKAWTDQHGGDSQRLQFVEMPFSSMAPALLRGRVVAAPIVEPTLSAALKAGGIRELQPPFQNVFGLHFMVGGWFATRDWLERNRALARRFVDAIYTSARWANAHPNESALIVAKYAKLDPVVVLGMNRSTYGTSLTPEMLQPVLDVSYKYGVFARPMAASDLIATP